MTHTVKGIRAAPIICNINSNAVMMFCVHGSIWHDRLSTTHDALQHTCGYTPVSHLCVYPDTDGHTPANVPCVPLYTVCCIHSSLHSSFSCFFWFYSIHLTFLSGSAFGVVLISVFFSVCFVVGMIVSSYPVVPSASVEPMVCGNLLLVLPVVPCTILLLTLELGTHSALPSLLFSPGGRGALRRGHETPFCASRGG